MKQFYLFATLFVCLTINVNAQNWSTLGPLIDIFTEQQENEFNEDVDELTFDLFLNTNDTISLADFEFGLAQDSLLFYMSNDNQLGTTDSLTGVWGMHNDELNNFFNNTNLSEEDSTTVSNDFFRINDIWNNEYDSLNTIILSSADSLGTLDSSLVEDGFRRYDMSQGPLANLFGELEEGQLPTLFDDNDNIGVDNIGEALDTTLFSSALDLEMAFGQEWSTTRFYSESYDVRASLMRFASVPRLDQNFEFRWALQGSFFNADENLIRDEVDNLEDGMNPYICHGETSILYTPMLSCFNNTIFRLYTSVGMEAATYVPSHRIEDDPRFADRVGKTTGYGPQLGVGFSVAHMGMLFYSYGTVARGDVINAEDLGYNFHSMAINAGARFGDAVNIRYSYGDYAWAPNGNKSSRFSRFTVGIILDELNR
ncbi:MAG: hypothetical protein AAGJ82_08260 [Bacteroidota bacterium]